MDGFLNIDKPRNMTSFDVIRKLKPRLPNKIKLGHLGTLDPMATGVLPVAVGQASKLIPYSGEDNKEYLATFTFGAVSDTQDAMGHLELTGNNSLNTGELLKVLNSFRGIIQQKPPMYSAVHFQGQRLYELARQGLVVDREFREIEITGIELIDVVLNNALPEAVVKVACSRGTYIRTLCHDVGQKMGTGAFLSALRRIKSGIFSVNNAVSLDYLLDTSGDIQSWLMPLDCVLQHLPPVNINNETELCVLKNGGSVIIDSTFDTNVRLYSPSGLLVGIASSKVKENCVYLQPVRIIT